MGDLIDELEFGSRISMQSCGEINKPHAISNGIYLSLHIDCM